MVVLLYIVTAAVLPSGQIVLSILSCHDVNCNELEELRRGTVVA